MAEATTPRTGPQSFIDQMGQWPLSRKLSLAAVTLISIALFAVIIIQARTADYQLLYSNLTASDAGQTVEWLKSQNIPYQIKGNGSNIWVPTSSVYEARLNLAAAGLPQGGGVGFEIFDKQSFALTDFVQKVNYTRALQGELSRTISSLGPVESARVHLALPEKRLFKNQQKKASASIILKMLAGRHLSDSQVQGIVHLVSSSIEGLTPTQITVIDQNGSVLSGGQEQGIAGKMSPHMLEFQLEIERNLEARAQSLLDTALGENNSMARVTAMLDFSQSEKTEETFDAEEPVIRSEQHSEEKSGSEIVGGIPGVQSNLQGTTSRSAATPPSSKIQRTTNYEISKVISKTINPVGAIKKISVAVLVADKIVPGENDAPAKNVTRSQDELNSLKSMISSALGLDLTRGDKIEVISMPFTEKAEVETIEEIASASNIIYQYMPLIRYGLLLLGGLLIYFLMVRPIIKTFRDGVKEHYKTVAELERDQLSMGGSEQMARHGLDPISRIQTDIAQDPGLTAHVVKEWMKDK